MATPTKEMIGRFQLECLLGRGSFSTVWRAYDPNLDRDVAIKLPRFEINRQNQDNFLREAKRVAQLKHEGIVRVFEADIDHVTSTPYIVLELVDGVTLSEWCTFVESKAIDVARMLVQITWAVHHAHSVGIIHRDLKPANVLVGLSGKPQVTDFGLAKAIGVDSSAETSTIGTIAYMSPEQAGLIPVPVSSASDVYALGVVLFELLSGVNPIDASTPSEYLAKLATGGRKALTDIKRDIPVDLVVICERAMEYHPHDRFLTAQEFAEELERYIAGSPILSRRPSSYERIWRTIKRHRQLIPLLMVILTGVLLWLVTSYYARERFETERIAHRDAALNNLLNCKPSGVPGALSDIAPFLEEVGPRLDQLIEAEKMSDQFRSLFASAFMGRPVTDRLIAAIPRCDSNEAPNLIDAFLCARDTSARTLSAVFDQDHTTAKNSSDRKRIARIAITLAHVGDLHGVISLSKIDDDPTDRSALLAEWPEFHGDLDDVLRWVDSDVPYPLLAVLSEILGKWDHGSFSENQRIGQVLRKLHTSHPSAAVHAASSWALGQRSVGLSRENVHYPPESEWFELEYGLVMIRLPRSSSQSSNILISAREITIGQYYKFRHDHEIVLQKKFQGDHSPDDAVRSLSAKSMFEYCNFLSDQYGLKRCYRRTVQPNASTTDYMVDFESNGFRLPTVSEWTYANLAGSRKGYFYGDDDIDLSRHANVSGLPQAAPTKMFPPNVFGLFDTLGNVAEACHLDTRELIGEIKFCGGSMYPIPGEHRGVVPVIKTIDYSATALGFRVVVKDDFSRIEAGEDGSKQ
ncbi:MAG: bifunctional serine/threonine-protein kinase/formylglycine-generating enzyme family protein [Pirellula sp.]|nr:bifunctional serine/threonine-protein kinase/formylglycine-generating enzyme family protein [Pirellula sp.]